MKIFKKVLCCLCALIVSGAILYADILFAFPKEITMYQHQNHNSRLGAGVSIGDIPSDVYASSSADTVTPIKSGKFEARLKIANVIPFRTVKLTVTQPQNLNASGELIGLRL
ncbi:MAG: hypothetical protein IJZ81_04420, partial [Clostridia bacterium]|nr:hypothetical protein [Clostridia bacterium]